jgi:hypothetical protein
MRLVQEAGDLVVTALLEEPLDRVLKISSGFRVQRPW